MIEHVWGLHLRLESPHKHEHGFRYYIYIYIYTYIRTCAARQITWYPRKAGPATEKGIPGNSFYAIEPLTHVWSPTIEKCAKIIERIYRFNIWIDHTRRKSSNARPQTSDHILYVHPMQIDQIDLAPGQTTSNRSGPTHRTRPDQTDRSDSWLTLSAVQTTFVAIFMVERTLNGHSGQAYKSWGNLFRSLSQFVWLVSWLVGGSLTAAHPKSNPSPFPFFIFSYAPVRWQLHLIKCAIWVRKTKITFDQLSFLRWRTTKVINSMIMINALMTVKCSTWSA